MCAECRIFNALYNEQFSRKISDCKRFTIQWQDNIEIEMKLEEIKPKSNTKIWKHKENEHKSHFSEIIPKKMVAIV